MALPTEPEILASIPTLSNLTLLKTCGQKAVYRGNDDRFGEVVVKVILSQTADERTKREIDVAQANNIAYVPKIHAHGEIRHSSGMNYYLMEQYIDGGSLEDFYLSGRKLSFPQSILLLETLLTLAVACEKLHIVHRDLKPGNILFDSKGIFWVIDFGIARHLDLPSITGSADAFGPHTAGYAPPNSLGTSKTT
ncbi:protein kinase [Geobacter sp. FeAm09]|uniref:serine/threonine protein kinase n=1 Tax=Geobacter sp. FeAm09 TaxID=2597769 RepID=UPI0011EC7072|nr:protein kinase [Geobacter sp. FeAm09]QEM67096.1 protein kinase [Geobacter sp. FeAm09]